MFCKYCGKENLDEAKFCVACGKKLFNVSEHRVFDFAESNNLQTLPTPGKSISSKVVNKINIFQRISVLAFIMWIIVIAFYIPYKGDGTIVYDTFWSGRSNINLFLLIVQLLILIGVEGIVYKMLAPLSNLPEHTYKRKGKREFYLFSSLLTIVAIFGIYMAIINFVSSYRKEKIQSEIITLSNRISNDVDNKRAIRKRFFNEVADIDWFDRKVHVFWKSVLSFVNDDNSMAVFYGNFETHRDGEKYNLLQEHFNLHNSNELRTFLLKNDITKTDFETEAQNARFNEKISALEEKKGKLKFFSTKEERINILFSLIFGFGLMYIGRPLLVFLKNTFSEIK